VARYELPYEVNSDVVALSNCDVEEAKRPDLNQSVGVEVEYTCWPKLVSAENGNEPPPVLEIVIGEEPNIVNDVHEVEPEHEAVVVATFPRRAGVAEFEVQ
jgi:hypothetical protein